MQLLTREVETLLRSQNALFAGALHAQADLREADGVGAERARWAQLLEDFGNGFDSLDAFDSSLHGVSLGFSKEMFAEFEALLQETACRYVAAADALMRGAEDAGVPARSYRNLKQRRDEWHAAIAWTDEDYPASPEFMDLLKDAVEEYEAGETEEGGFGR